MSVDLHYTIKKTQFGELVIIWQRFPEVNVKRILLPNFKEKLRSEYPLATRSLSKKIGDLAEGIALFLEGKDARFNLDILDLSLCRQFQRSVIIAEHGIPRGWVSTYSRIAKYLGRPKSSRAVGRALATNPFPIVVPCHRAIRNNGDLGGYQGGVKMKKRLLEMEGIQFSPSGKVIMNKMYYDSMQNVGYA